MIELGQVNVHPAAEDAVAQGNQRVEEFLDRFRIGDYGDIDQEVRHFNEHALKNGGDLLGIYQTCGGDTIYVISSGTTTEVILP
jgi:hypothetical protein